MSKVILSTDLNEDYLFYAPITSFVWKYFDFSPILYIIIGKEKSNNLPLVLNQINDLKINTKIYLYENISSFRDCTLAQTIRLFGWKNEQQNEYIVLGDIDMIPLNSFLNRDFDKLNVFGFDLTGRTQIPMCYVGMKKYHWERVIKNDINLNEYQETITILNSLSNSKSDIFDNYWYCDQEILTKSILNYGHDNFNFIDRGNESNGYAFKRVDRGNWNWDKSKEYMDSHLLRNPEKNFPLVFDLIKNYIKNCDWMMEYYNKFYNK